MAGVAKCDFTAGPTANENTGDAHSGSRGARYPDMALTQGTGFSPEIRPVTRVTLALITRRTKI
jgi:hypothetical protein